MCLVCSAPPPPRFPLPFFLPSRPQKQLKAAKGASHWITSLSPADTARGPRSGDSEAERHGVRIFAQGSRQQLRCSCGAFGCTSLSFCFYRYSSVKAIETKSPVDDQQWLTYWVLYSLITLFELTFASIIVKKGIVGKSDDFVTVFDKFIEENGAEALKKLTNKDGWSSKQARKSSKDSKESKSSKDAKQTKPPKDLKPSKDSREQKAWKDTKEQKKALKDTKELKKALKDSGEPKPKSNKQVTFAEVEPKKEFKASNHDWHPSSDYHITYPEHHSWNNSFMIFEDENSYWT